MSKTVGNVQDPLDYIERYGAEALRYFLLREISPFEDGDFTEERFREAYHAGLANGLGNYVSRVATMIARYFNGVLQKPLLDDLARVPVVKQPDPVLLSYFFDQIIHPAYEHAMERYELKRAMDVTWEALGELDRYVDFYQPFHLIKTDPEKTRAVLWNLAEGALSVAWLLKPFMPETADTILRTFGIDVNDHNEWKEVRIKLEGPLFMRKE